MVTISKQKEAIIEQLQKDLLLWQGYKPANTPIDPLGLGALEEAFPNRVFPLGSIQECICLSGEQLAATNGFIAGLLSSLMANKGVCVWIHTSHRIFPPALQAFGVHPERIVFIELPNPRNGLWVMEEALKCTGVAAVIVELPEITFAQSRRLQWVVEKSKVTGFVLRHQPKRMGTTAAAVRWHIQPLPSALEKGMPGVGFPRWRVTLLKVRNGQTGTWDIAWRNGRFMTIPQEPKIEELQIKRRKVG